MTLKIKSIEELDHFQKFTLSEFSYSRIDTYEMCPSKYFFSYIKKEPRRFNAPAVLGNIVHSVLEDCISKDSDLDIGQMKKLYKDNLLSYDPAGKIPKELVDVGDEIVEEFFDLNKNKKFNVYGKEVGFNFVIGNYSIIGYIDRVDVINNDVYIVDYKTGKREVALKDIPSNLQLRNIRIGSQKSFPR